VRVLWVATKPPLPAIDGGRLVTVETLRALDRIGVGGVLVAPAPRAHTSELGSWRIVCVPGAALHRRLAGIVRAGSLTVARHLQPAVARAVARVLDDERIDVVHAEQLQALPQCGPAIGRGVPVVLRAQNVEHEVLAARFRRPVLRMLAGVERRRLVACETHAVATAAATIALTQADAARLAALAAAPIRIHHVPPPFPEVLPAGPRLGGEPSVVVFGDAGWFPNVDGAAWFVERAWPTVRTHVPGARLHVIGLPLRDRQAPDVEVHPPPDDSATGFPDGAVLVVPTRVKTGVRMKVLEAWARGIPVVSTPEAASGLAAVDGEQVLLANDAAAFADAIRRIAHEPDLAARLRASGRAVLRRHHDPHDVATRILRLYEAACGRVRAPGGRPQATSAAS
jgi:hypothetical protein